MSSASLEAGTAALWRRIGPVAVPLLAALVAGAVVLLATGAAPLQVYGLMAREAVGSVDRIAATLTASVPLLFTGAATAVAFRAGVFNVGVEGSFVAGGLAAAVVGFSLEGVPGPLVATIALVLGAAVGAAVALVPGLLRGYLGVDEVVTTLMLNYVVANMAAWLVTSVFLAPGVANSATPTVAEAAWLPRLMPPSALHAGLLLALVVLAVVAYWQRGTASGFELGMVGRNPRFSQAQGIDVTRAIVLAMVVSGAVGGLGGGVHAVGQIHRFVVGFSSDYGFTGIAVALLGRNRALGVLAAALLFGALASAGSTVQLFSSIPLDIVDVLKGTVMIFAVVRVVGRRRGVAP